MHGKGESFSSCHSSGFSIYLLCLGLGGGVLFQAVAPRFPHTHTLPDTEKRSLKRDSAEGLIVDSQSEGRTGSL